MAVSIKLLEFTSRRRCGIEKDNPAPMQSMAAIVAGSQRRLVTVCVAKTGEIVNGITGCSAVGSVAEVFFPAPLPLVSGCVRAKQPGQ